MIGLSMASRVGYGILGAVVLGGSVVASGPPAHADGNGVTITVDPVAVERDPTLVDVSAQITCDPMTVEVDQRQANLQQAVPGGIAFGSGWSQQPVVCDGSSHTNTFSVWIDTSSPSGFRVGSATVVVSAYLCTNTPEARCQSGSSGVQVVRIRRARIG